MGGEHVPRAAGDDSAPPTNRDPGEPLLLTLAGVATLLQVSERTVQRLVANRVLSCVRLTPRVIRIRRGDLEAYVAGLTSTAIGPVELVQAPSPRRVGRRTEPTASSWRGGWALARVPQTQRRR